jgi:hypothetical protein
VSISVLLLPCISVVTCGLPEGLINLSLSGFPQTGVFPGWLPKSRCAHVFCDCCSLLLSAAILA